MDHDTYWPMFHRFTVSITKAYFYSDGHCVKVTYFLFFSKLVLSAHYYYISFVFLSCPMASCFSIIKCPAPCFSASHLNPHLQGNKIFWKKSINYTKEAKRWPHLWIMHRRWLCSANNRALSSSHRSETRKKNQEESRLHNCNKNVPVVDHVYAYEWFLIFQTH